MLPGCEAAVAALGSAGTWWSCEAVCSCVCVHAKLHSFQARPCAQRLDWPASIPWLYAINRGRNAWDSSLCLSTSTHVQIHSAVGEEGWLWVWVVWAAGMALTTYNAAADAILPLVAVPVMPKQLLWGLYACYGLVAAGPVYRGISEGPRSQTGGVMCRLLTNIEFGYNTPPAMLCADAIWPLVAAFGSAIMYVVMFLCAVVLPVLWVVSRVVWLGWSSMQLGIDSLTQTLIAARIGLEAVWFYLGHLLSAISQAAFSPVHLCIDELLRWPAAAGRSVAAVHAGLLHGIDAVLVKPYVAVPALYRRSVSAMHTVFRSFMAVPSAFDTYRHTHRQSSKEDTLQEGVTPVEPGSGRLWVLLAGVYLGVAAVLVVQGLWAKRHVLLQRWRGHSNTAPPTSAAAAGGAQAASTAAGSSAGMQQHLREEVNSAVECIACQEAVRTVCLRPCGHVVLCGACFDTIARNARRETVGGRMACPICRQEVKRHERGLWIV